MQPGGEARQRRGRVHDQHVRTRPQHDFYDAGQLDVDSNVQCIADGSVENVFWPPGQAPAGTYAVEVDGFDVGDDIGCGSGDYVLTIRVTGAEDQVIRDSVLDGETDTFTFQVG